MLERRSVRGRCGRSIRPIAQCWSWLLWNGRTFLPRNYLGNGEQTDAEPEYDQPSDDCPAHGLDLLAIHHPADAGAFSNGRHLYIGEARAIKAAWRWGKLLNLD
jgi:hypothetical protein